MAKRMIEGPEPYEINPEADAKATAMIEEAERDIEELRVNMRWGKEQLAVIKHAALLFGMPYQTYVKQAAFRQALTDVRDAEAVMSKVAR